MTSDFRRLLVAVTVAAYAVLIAGTTAGWLVPQLRILNVIGMAVLVAWWVRGLLRAMDRVDMATILIVVAVGISTLFSILPRLSIEAFYGSVAFAAVFGCARRLGERDQQIAMRALRFLTAVLAAAILIIWGSTWLRWLDLTGWSAPPPLAMRLPGAPFGHPHDAALVVGLMAPSLLATRLEGRHWLHNLVVGLTVAAVAAVLFMNGSRAIWAATLFATVIAVAASGRLGQVWLWIRSRWVAVAAIVGIVAIIAIVTGLTGAISNRLLATISLDQRLAVWTAAIQSWLDHPVTGTGPGTLQFSFQATDYFDHAVHAPEHTDNLYVQVPAELGILGAAALIILGGMVVLAWRRRSPPLAAVWALTFALVVSIGSNPSALGYCAILIGFWAGVATPWQAERAGARLGRPLAIMAAASLLLAAVPIVLATLAAVAFDAARSHVLADDDDRAGESLDAAVALDPSFPLYRRARGVHLLNTGSLEAGRGDLERAARLNPLDDTSWRAFAVAALQAGDTEVARRAAETAVGLQWTDAMNHALLAHVAGQATDGTAREAARDVALIAQWASADPAWAVAIADVEPSKAVRDAAAGVGRLDGSELDPRWPTALAGESPPSGTAQPYTGSQRALALLVGCDLDRARVTLDEAASAELDAADYWIVRIIVNGLRAEPADSARYVLGILSPLTQGHDPSAGSPVSDVLVDEASYSRRPILAWDGIALPSNRAGLQHWLEEPNVALAAITGQTCD